MPHFLLCAMCTFARKRLVLLMLSCMSLQQVWEYLYFPTIMQSVLERFIILQSLKMWFFIHTFYHYQQLVALPVFLLVRRRDEGGLNWLTLSCSQLARVQAAQTLLARENAVSLSSQCSGPYLFIKPGSSQKSQSRSRKPQNPDPDTICFLTLTVLKMV